MKRGKTMGYLSAKAIFDADDQQFDEIDVPEWGGTLRLRSISGAQRDAYEASLIDERSKDRKMNLANARAKLIVMCAVDETGSLLFTSEDIRRLGRKNAKPVDRVFDACKKLAGLSDEDVDRLVEDFDPTQDEASSTD